MSKRSTGIAYVTGSAHRIGNGALQRVAEYNRKRSKKTYKHPAARKQAKLKRVREAMEATRDGS